MPGLIIAATSSGAGKTTVTLGLLRALSRQGIAIRGAKSGPDYIDPAFHAAASGRPCYNLDAWAMPPKRLHALARGEELLIIEGAMGLFDGAPPDGKGSVADLARLLSLPVVLVVDAARMSQSIAPLVQGFARHDPKVRVAGVIVNRVGSPRHEAMLRHALRPLGIPVLGAIPRSTELSLPSRHLGLVQAHEHRDLETFLSTAANTVAQHIDLAALTDLAHPLPAAAAPAASHSPMPGASIAVAQDQAFAFLYPHQLRDWEESGVQVRTFSPLADEAVPDADWVFLPGGYPELHADRLANASRFLDSLRDTARFGHIYGECGGYMVLGEALTDTEGRSHKMAGLLGLHTSFAERKLHLGYRDLVSHSTKMPGAFKGHEFHYATTLHADGEPLFDASDAEGTPLAPMGLQEGNVLGSFAHIIDSA